MQRKCSLRGKIERASRPNQLLRLGTNVPSALHSATCRLLVQLWEFPFICLMLRALGTELGPVLFLSYLILSPPASILGAPVCAPGALGVLVPVAAAPSFVLGLFGAENRALSELVPLWFRIPIACQDNVSFLKLI